MGGLLCAALSMSVALTSCKKDEILVPSTVIVQDASVTINLKAYGMQYGKEINATFTADKGTLSGSTLTLTGNKIENQTITVTCTADGYESQTKTIGIPEVPAGVQRVMTYYFVLSDGSFQISTDTETEVPGKVVLGSTEKKSEVVAEETPKFDAGKENTFTTTVEVGTIIKEVAKVKEAINALTFDNPTIDMATRAALSDAEKEAIVEEAKEKLNNLLVIFGSFAKESKTVAAYVKEGASKVTLKQVATIVDYLQDIVITVQGYDFTIKNVKMQKRTVDVQVVVDDATTHHNGGDVTGK